MSRIEEGQIWKEDDKRFDRYVRVEFVCVGGERVRIKRCHRDGTFWKAGRSTEASAARFGKRGGYKLLEPQP